MATTYFNCELHLYVPSSGRGRIRIRSHVKLLHANALNFKSTRGHEPGGKRGSTCANDPRAEEEIFRQLLVVGCSQLSAQHKNLHIK